jgi:predicted nuclease of predicted toxin-antitoxin system
MKLLFDQNLSPSLVTKLADLYPNSNHVFWLGLDKADDRKVREYAEQNDFIIVTKDVDYSDLYMLFGFPPRIIWIRRGNCSTSTVQQILRNHFEDIKGLSENSAVGILTIY